jgi:short-subunit dehydrogenase
MQKAIIIGASSGIGKSLAKILADNNYITGITGRREELLLSMQSQNPDKFIVKAFDVRDTVNSIIFLEELLSELGGLDLLVISSGTGDLNEDLDFSIEKMTIDTNVVGFTAIADWGFNYFRKHSAGHLVAISSVGGLRGSRGGPSYSASKAYQINYMEALQQKAQYHKMPVTITDIRPGFVDTDMAKGDGQFWVASVEKASKQIFHGIRKKKKLIYVTRRWRLVAAVIKRIPSFLYSRM